jgi:hypothetical protein
MAIEMVSFPINSMVIFHSYVNVYQRVIQIEVYPNNTPPLGMVYQIIL